jgi:predicted ester cyclase
MTMDIKRTTERLPLEVLNDGKFGVLDEILATTFVDHTPQTGFAPTRDGLKQSLVEFKKAFPDLRYTIEDTIVSGDQIVYRLSATGTMTSNFMGIPATNKSATWNEIHILRVVDGLITEQWSIVDQLGLFVQLGVVPAPGRTPVLA